LDTSVATAFLAGSKAVKAVFNRYIAIKMAAYKKERYGTWYSWSLRAKDAAVGMPSEVNAFYKTAKKLYSKTMHSHLTAITNHVTAQLTAAKAKIQQGKQAVQSYVHSLSPNSRNLAKVSITKIQTKFNTLENNVNSKKNNLIDTLAKKQAQNLAGIDARIKA
jgi:hypothetical protein